MNLRKHQADTGQISDEIISGSPIKDIIIQAVPGSGKSSIPIIVGGKLIPAKLADAIAWVVPRMSLQDQAERNFLDPFFRKMFSHNLTIRSSTNENNPCRGTNGFCTTYQALGVDKDRTVLQDFRRKRYILILDEVHHASAEEGAAWTEALKPLVELAAFRIYMSGTLLRGDGKKIAFVDGQEKTETINYTRRDALADKAILPLEFILFDGQSKWQNARGDEEEAAISTQESEKGCYALYTALHTDYAKELLTAAITHWKQHRIRKSGHGKLLVVAADIKQAKQYTAFLKSIGEHAKIATSDDTPAAVKTIKELKTGALGIVVSVGMCYEGLDVPAISHIACLTNIRSLPWISQMVARAVRIDPLAGPYETQTAYVFAPKDRLFLECKEQIEKDQQWARHKAEREKKESSSNEASEPGFGLTSPGGITPLESKITDKIGIVNLSDHRESIMTPSETEEDLLKQIETHVNRYGYRNRISPKRLNFEIFEHFGKSRRDMTVPELEACLAYVKSKYSMAHIRGTGIERKSVKATPFTKRLLQDSLARMGRTA